MIKNHWYAIATSKQVRRQLGLMRFGIPLVLWRDSQDQLHCFEDRCLHRRTKLSLGKVIGDELQCGFHGFRYNQSGKCVKMPANGSCAKIPKNFQLRTFLVKESRGLIHLWWGDPLAATRELPWFDFDDSAQPFAETHIDAPVAFCRLMEANMDFAHFPFVHPNYFTANDQLIYAKDFQTTVNGNHINMKGKFCKDTPEAWIDDSGKAIEVSIQFPNLAMYPSPLDGKDDRLVISLAPISQTNTWCYIRSYVTPGPLQKLRQIIRKRIVLDLLWKHWVYHQDQRMIMEQEPADSGMHQDLLVSPSDRALAMYLKMYREAIDRQEGERQGAAASLWSSRKASPPRAPSESIDSFDTSELCATEN